MTASVSDFTPVEEPGLRVDVDYTQRLLTVAGELDVLTAPRLLAAAATLNQPGDMTVDLRGLTFIGAAGLNAAVEIRNAQQERHWELWLVGVSLRTKRVFVAGGLAGLLA
jgi:anti-anti-sigma factor